MNFMPEITFYITLSKLRKIGKVFTKVWQATGGKTAKLTLAKFYA